MRPLVTQSDDVAWGATVITGTRVPVNALFEYLERGKTLDEVLLQFPTVSREMAVAISSQRSRPGKTPVIGR